MLMARASSTLGAIVRLRAISGVAALLSLLSLAVPAGAQKSVAEARATASSLAGQYHRMVKDTDGSTMPAHERLIFDGCNIGVEYQAGKYPAHIITTDLVTATGIEMSGGEWPMVSMWSPGQT